VLPPGLYAGRLPSLLERSLMSSRRSWLNVVAGFVEPICYLSALDLGFGRMVSTVVGTDGRPIRYAMFVAPAMLAATAMNGAVYDAIPNTFHRLTYAKLYDSMVVTPLGPVDIALGEIGSALLHGGLYAAGFLAVLVASGLVVSWWGVFALPAALLIASAFAASGLAVATLMRGYHDFELVNLVILPMFFLSTTFYPLHTYPRPLQIAVECLPLYQGVALERALTTGIVGWGLVGHVLYLLGMTALGAVVAMRRLARRLIR
jgi:lipooligosaccharide transport system permease protein